MKKLGVFKRIFGLGSNQGNTAQPKNLPLTPEIGGQFC